MTRPKLCLNMIVRNEASIIERCLASVAPYVDAWVIGDTGSTDDTPRRIESCFAGAGIAGELHRFPFRNFEQARNEALDRARASALAFDYLMLVDADMELVVADRSFRDSLSAASYAVRQQNGYSYFNTRLLRRDVPARYVGVTHEYLDTPEPPARLADVWFIDHACGSNRNGKFERDAALLSEALSRDPGNARYTFYLAQSLRDAGRLREARDVYARRASMGGWEEEVWYSLFQAAALDERLGAHPAAVAHAYLAAFNARPTRAEPLVELARFHRLQRQWPLTLLYARAATQVSRPDDALFLDESSYTWRPWDEIAIAGYYAGALGEGRSAADRLLREARFPEAERARIEANRAYYGP